MTARLFNAKVVALAASLISVTAPACSAAAAWPLWDRYAQTFLDPQGRIVDFDAENRTTSEGQAYAMFFALVAGDRSRFAKLLTWTESNLAQGDLKTHLPAWTWGNTNGTWKITDSNSASDADLWIAYTLLEAGRLWNDQHYAAVGRALASRIASAEVADLKGLGKMLLPGSSGFRTSDGFYELNASYVPVQVLLGLAHHIPGGPWRDIAASVPRLVRGSSPAGFPLDWIAFRPGEGFSIFPSPVAQPAASYDAIRVYLWAGMLHPSCPMRSELLSSMKGMEAYLGAHKIPPAIVSPGGDIRNPAGSVGFSAAVVPFLRAVGSNAAAEQQLKRMEAEKDARTGLYGNQPRYYDQNLALFATGWYEDRFHYDTNGLLQVIWK